MKFKDLRRVNSSQNLPLDDDYTKKERSVPPKIQKFLIEVAIWLVVGTSCASVLYLPYVSYTSFGTISSIVITGIFSTLIPMVIIPSLGAELSDYHDQLAEECERNVPPHEYDEEVKFWEPFDKIEVKDGHGGKIIRRLIGFTDEGTVMLGWGHDGIDREDIESNSFTHEDFERIDEVRLQEIIGYRNASYEGREFDYKKKEKILKVKGSQYDETLSQLQEVEKEKLQALEEIYEEKSDIEKLDAQLEKEIQSNNSNDKKVY